jgi:streptomycin 6-kinase
MKAFEQNIINLYGEKGRQWLDDLPSLIAQVAKIYELSNLKLVNNLSYNYVLSGFQGSQPIILKLGLDIDGFKREAAAMMAFSGFGVVQVFSENAGLLLLECAVSGVSLKSYFPENDDEAINITANVIKRLHKTPIPSAYTFPHIKDWLVALDKNWNISAQYLQKARRLRDHLLKTSTKKILLHGDLHHDNILQNGDDWLVIDPKGVIGEEAFEVAAFIRNPIPELLNHNDALNIIHNRISRFAEILELPSQRIFDWCFVQAVLAWVWAIEDGCDDTYFKNLTELFQRHTDVGSR